MEITPSKTRIEDLFRGQRTRYKVPHYQRDYSWTIENIEELLSDLTNSWKRKSNYFMGAILLNKESGEEDCFDIVDGQQRLATFTVLLAVLRDFAKAYIHSSCDEFFGKVDRTNADNLSKAERIYQITVYYIVKLGSPDHYYIKLNDKDQNIFFEKIQKETGLLTLEDRKIVKNDKRLIKSKKKITQFVQENIINHPNGLVLLEDFLLHCTTNILLLRIDVETDSDAYLLFETLNDRGADLSIADLVKNRLLLSCLTDVAKRTRVLGKWEKIVETLQKSRYKAHDFLRFYWIAFHGNTTKTEVYDKIKKYLASGADVEVVVDDWLKNAEYFSEITDVGLTYLSGSKTYISGSNEQYYAEINTLGYSVCYPFLIAANKIKPDIIKDLLPVIVSYLFRLITIGGFAAGRAEKAFLNALSLLNTGNSLSDLKASFSDEEASDEKLKENISKNSFEDNKTARYFLFKIHQKSLGSGLRFTSNVHLEHILPQDPSKWTSFDTEGRHFDEWIYSIGNMTLLEKELNSTARNNVFAEKLKFFKQRTTEPEEDRMTTAIPMTYELHNRFSSKPEWTSKLIRERTLKLADQCCSVWAKVYEEPITQL